MAADYTMRRVLPNGLTAIARQQSGAPIGSFWVWYRVGGRNEVAGITGISHWVEHMQFKGTADIAAGEIFARSQRMAARSMASPGSTTRRITKRYRSTDSRSHSTSNQTGWSTRDSAPTRSPASGRSLSPSDRVTRTTLVSFSRRRWPASRFAHTRMAMVSSGISRPSGDHSR